MSKFKIIETPIKDLLIIETRIFKDERGFFMETYNQKEFEEIGLNIQFVQDNLSKSKKGVLRGLHFQIKHPQGKLIRVIKGGVYDVAVDLRLNSPTFGKWFGIELKEGDGLAFYIPEGFAHGFLTLEEETYFFYKCTDIYYAEYDNGVIWNDPEININWPIDKVENLTISEKDKKLPLLKEIVKVLKEEGN
ncbi:dTDP-4-dehydrorhamnose 3,5-epimerase [Caldisericum exile]|uniref:dTDP-4-dehydrorhamnose 3,5-epimerase n=1 Tax=Caldisericum exile TaxID=693075 RepID=UPI003C78C566